MKKLFTILTLGLVLGFSSCSDDDDDDAPLCNFPGVYAGNCADFTIDRMAGNYQYTDIAFCVDSVFLDDLSILGWTFQPSADTFFIPVDNGVIVGVFPGTSFNFNIPYQILPAGNLDIDGTGSFNPNTEQMSLDVTVYSRVSETSCDITYQRQ